MTRCQEEMEQGQRGRAHGPAAVWDLVEADRAVKDEARDEGKAAAWSAARAGAKVAERGAVWAGAVSDSPQESQRSWTWIRMCRLVEREGGDERCQEEMERARWAWDQ